jgi:hypothetical protein
MADLDDRLLDPAVLAQASRNEAAVIIAARTISHTLAAQRLGISKQAQSDYLRDQLKRLSKVLAAYDLKVVPKADKTYSDAYMAALGLMAHKGIDALVPAPAVAALNGARVVDEGDTVPGGFE